MVLIAPDGTVYREHKRIPQGLYERIYSPTPGEWKMVIQPQEVVIPSSPNTASNGFNSNFVARAYTHNRVNNFIASLRKPSIEVNEEIYVYAIVNSIGGAITKQDEKIIAEVTLPNGKKDVVTLLDNGRDAQGHGDDIAGDGIFTGVYYNTVQKGAYGFHFKVNVDKWVLGSDAHKHDQIESSRFLREVRISAGVRDPKDVVTHPEDDPQTQPGNCEVEAAIYRTDDKTLSFEVLATEFYNPITDKHTGEFSLFTGKVILQGLPGFYDFEYVSGNLTYANHITQAKDCYPTYSALQKTLYLPKVVVPMVSVLPDWLLLEGPKLCYKALLKQANTREQIFTLIESIEIPCE